VCLCVFSQFKTVSEVLSGARHMVAMQLAHEPLVRQVVREAIIDRLKLSCAPTKKGFKVRFFWLLVARYSLY
jgi:transcription elongation factor SPT6